MVPLLSDELTAKEKRYNSTHKKCRCCVERAIGVLKSRFRCLCKKTGGGIQHGELQACKIIMSCIVLHNYCRTRNLEFPLDSDVAEMIQQENKINVNRRYVEHQRYEEQLKLGQLARAAIVSSF